MKMYLVLIMKWSRAGNRQLQSIQCILQSISGVTIVLCIGPSLFISTPTM